MRIVCKLAAALILFFGLSTTPLGVGHSLGLFNEPKASISLASQVAKTAQQSSDPSDEGGTRSKLRGNTPEDFFQQRIVPVFDQKCLICHGSAVQRSALDVRSKDSLLKGGSSGPAIRPGNAEESLLYQLITHQREPAMPMGGEKLSDDAIQAIAEWINSLSPDEAVVEADGSSVPIRPPGTEVSDQDRKFWSFVKPSRPSIPATQQRNWIRNEIDVFVLHAMESKNLKPSPAAEPAALLRRAYIDLIGLPPSPEEVQGFLANPSSDAFSKVVDRLLASPHYGERWGRHWLDLARYADSGGFEFDVDRPNAWRYRDYVIQAFNDDKPYDQFVREQLAGDESQPGSTEASIATGFCRNGPTVDNANNEQTRMDELDDMISTTGSVFLGLTVGCARCHDHKYDPMSQQDYYRLQAIFSPSEKTDRSLAGNEEKATAKARNDEIDDVIKPLKERLAQIERPAREWLLAEKVQRFMVLTEQAGALADQDREAFRRRLAEQFAKEVKLQPEEIEAHLSPQGRLSRKAVLEEIERLNRTRPKPMPAVMGITDKAGPVPKTFLLKRGDFRQKGEEVLPGFPSVLSRFGLYEPAPSGSTRSLRRLKLAQWLTQPSHPLTARVFANRLWQYHFGVGLVKTSSDFGFNGERPSHPELLDWLATEFVSRAWSIKEMHRLIMNSNTYQQSSQANPAAMQVDPENRLLWRFSPSRLDAEVIRDSILAVSGQLNPDMGGPGIYPRIDPAVIGTGSTNKWPIDVVEGPPTWRRSVYIFQKRSVVLPLLEVFDCPDSTVSSPTRSDSVVAPQALALMNNEFVLEQARYFAQRVVSESGLESSRQVQRAYLLALGRAPSSKELSWSVEFLAQQSLRHTKRATKLSASLATGPAMKKSLNPARFAALVDFCHAIFNLNEFLYAD